LLTGAAKESARRLCCQPFAWRVAFAEERVRRQRVEVRTTYAAQVSPKELLGKERCGAGIWRGAIVWEI